MIICSFFEFDISFIFVKYLSLFNIDYFVIALVMEIRKFAIALHVNTCVCLSVYLHIFLFVCISNLSVLSIYPFTYLSTYLSIHAHLPFLFPSQNPLSPYLSNHISLASFHPQNNNKNEIYCMSL